MALEHGHIAAVFDSLSNFLASILFLPRILISDTPIHLDTWFFSAFTADKSDHSVPYHPIDSLYIGATSYPGKSVVMCMAGPPETNVIIEDFP